VTMPRIDLDLDGDDAWSDLDPTTVIDAGSTLRIAALGDGMASGRASIAIRIDLPGGQTVIAQTSVRALAVAVRAILARYPDPEIQ
jgi:hypothetical protein